MTKVLYMPSGLQEIIESKVSKPYQIHYFYIIHKLCWINLTSKDYYEDCGVKVNNKLTSEILQISPNTTTKIISNLIGWNIIRRTSGYKKGLYSCSYKLNPEWENIPVKRINLSQKQFPIIQTIVKQEQPTTRIERKTISILKNRVSISEEGVSYIKGKYPAIESEIAEIEPEDIVLITFYFKEFFVKRPDSSSRLFTNLTSLKKEFKKYIQLDGKPIIQTDLVNSQIVFGVSVLDKHFKEFLGDDFSRFKELSLSGGIYEYLAEESGFIEAGNELEGEVRKEFKQKFFKEVWYSTTNPKKKKLLQVFADKFPSVYQVISEIKRDDYTAWPVYLQQAESELFIDKVLKSLLNEGIDALSIHDSIVLTDQKDLRRAEELISKSFNELYCIKPKLKAEYTF